MDQQGSAWRRPPGVCFFYTTSPSHGLTRDPKSSVPDFIPTKGPPAGLRSPDMPLCKGQVDHFRQTVKACLHPKPCVCVCVSVLSGRHTNLLNPEHCVSILKEIYMSSKRCTAGMNDCSRHHRGCRRAKDLHTYYCICRRHSLILCGHSRLSVTEAEASLR